jgi:D-alanyl-lipoteichoic acid acyltransferase DltB (MBOAT superfamily)
MLFQTPEFLVLILVVLAYLAAFKRGQHLFLILASYVFYGWWDIRFLFLILLSTVIDYTAALGIDAVRFGGRRLAALSALLAGGTLFFLVPNWPALQDHSLDEFMSDPIAPINPQSMTAIGICVVFSIAAPLAYRLFFRLEHSARRKAFLITSVVANLGVLGFFKYFNFFVDSIASTAAAMDIAWAAPALTVALPVGISFYTFQTMSYTIDVYRGDMAAERSFPRVALFVAYFPQLVAGPIIRPQQFFPTLNKPWTVTGTSMRSGMNLALVGLFKKVMIADNVAPFVDTVFTNPQGQSSLVIMLGAAAFAVQIYCDFSGYTDIARGISRIFGVEIPLNFNFPYFATSIIDFWRRWHISLSTWLRDYLYISIGGNRLGVGRTYANLMVTMVLGGLWHGASWNFVIWGAYQGALLCINRVLRNAIALVPALDAALKSKPGSVVRWAVTLYFWLLGWLIFRLTDFDNLVYCLKKFVLFDGRLALGGLGLGRGDPVVAFLAIFIFSAMHTVGYFSKRWDERLTSAPLALRLLAYTALGVLFCYGWPTTAAPFIYFQF